ncbi:MULTISPECIES: CDI toxin immunity protein [unclassified Paenibacillus]|uniref:CDI toxin immunity protein n=1 Tax=unclassified Paenibacillus TaxID=185978 RepID=UPI0030F9018C
MTLFEECIQALGDGTEIVTIQKTEELFNHLVSWFPVTSWGRINWDNISRRYEISKPQEVISIIKNELNGDFNSKVFLLWNYTDAPSIYTELSQVLNNIDDVTAVGSDTWIFCPSSGYVIEYFHEGQVMLGFKD